MKSYIILGICLLMAFTGQAQDEKKREIEFKVFGSCADCKKRIERSLFIKGVKHSEWSVETKILKVVYDPRKIEEDAIHEAVIAIGHDTEKLKAKDEVYDKLHHCCKYEREKKKDE